MPALAVVKPLSCTAEFAHLGLIDMTVNLEDRPVQSVPALEHACCRVYCTAQTAVSCSCLKGVVSACGGSIGC
jgi:hypothetical protein